MSRSGPSATGKAATSEQANKIIGIVRKIVVKLYGDAFAQNLRILYGGSVTADNITELMKQPEIDGGLVGGASLKVDVFSSIVKQTGADSRNEYNEFSQRFEYYFVMLSHSISLVPRGS